MLFLFFVIGVVFGAGGSDWCELIRGDYISQHSIPDDDVKSILYGDECFLIDRNKVDSNTAVTKCSSVGGGPATFNDQDEFVFAMTFIHNNGYSQSCPWTGYYDENGNTQYWDSGKQSLQPIGDNFHPVIDQGNNGEYYCIHTNASPEPSGATMHWAWTVDEEVFCVIPYSQQNEIKFDYSNDQISRIDGILIEMEAELKQEHEGEILALNTLKTKEQDDYDAAVIAENTWSNSKTAYNTRYEQYEENHKGFNQEMNTIYEIRKILGEDNLGYLPTVGSFEKHPKVESNDHLPIGGGARRRKRRRRRRRRKRKRR